MDQGRCKVVGDDRDGQLLISPEVAALTVTIELWDVRGNHERTTITLDR